MTYHELKEYFETAELPETLRGKDIALYYSLPFQVNAWIEQVDGEIERLGFDKIKHSPMARHAKMMLNEVYQDLKVKDNWNKGLYTIEEKKQM